MKKTLIVLLVFIAVFITGFFSYHFFLPPEPRKRPVLRSLPKPTPPKDGKVDTFYEDDTLKSSVYMIDGKKDGLETGYFPNGGLKYEYFFYAGSPIGIWKRYHLDGSLLEETTYHVVRPGKSRKFYYPSGALWVIAEEDENRTLTHFTCFDSSGTEMPFSELQSLENKAVMCGEMGRLSWGSSK